MKFTLDTDAGTLVEHGAAGPRELPLYSNEAFAVLADQWLRVGWNQKYQYTFSWFGRPVIQLPEDMIRTQEVIWRLQPDLIIETGVAHGGSLVFYASLCRAIGKGQVVGIDIEIRPHNRVAIEAHPLSPLITLIEGSSIDPATVAAAAARVRPGETVLVLLDSNHSFAHVAAELEAYCGLVTPGSYIVATDGIMENLADVPRGRSDWVTDNPATAARQFAAQHPEFILEQPAWAFNESGLHANLSHWPDAWLRRL